VGGDDAHFEGNTQLFEDFRGVVEVGWSDLEPMMMPTRGFGGVGFGHRTSLKKVTGGKYTGGKGEIRMANDETNPKNEIRIRNGVGKV